MTVLFFIVRLLCGGPAYLALCPIYLAIIVAICVVSVSLSAIGAGLALLLGAAQAVMTDDSSAFLIHVRAYIASLSSNWRGFWWPALRATVIQLALEILWILHGARSQWPHQLKEISLQTTRNSLFSTQSDIPGQWTNLLSHSKPIALTG